MGRRKIVIERIADDRTRFVTFTKRRFGVIKKSMELSMLGDCEIALVAHCKDNNQWYQYVSSGDTKGFIQRWQSPSANVVENLSNSKFEEFMKRNRNNFNKPFEGFECDEFNGEINNSHTDLNSSISSSSSDADYKLDGKPRAKSLLSPRSLDRIKGLKNTLDDNNLLDKSFHESSFPKLSKIFPNGSTKRKAAATELSPVATSPSGHRTHKRVKSEPLSITVKTPAAEEKPESWCTEPDWTSPGASAFTDAFFAATTPTGKGVMDNIFDTYLDSSEVC